MAKKSPKSRFPRIFPLLLRADCAKDVARTKRRHADGKESSREIVHRRRARGLVEEHLWRHDYETRGVFLSGSRCNWRQPDSRRDESRVGGLSSLTVLLHTPFGNTTPGLHPRRRTYATADDVAPYSLLSSVPLSKHIQDGRQPPSFLGKTKSRTRGST